RNVTGVQTCALPIFSVYLGHVDRFDRWHRYFGGLGDHRARVHSVIIPTTVGGSAAAACRGQYQARHERPDYGELSFLHAILRTCSALARSNGRTSTS